MKKIISCLALFCLILPTQLLAQTREIAITVDDLPLVASKMNNPANRQRAIERFSAIVTALKEYQVPALGFVIAGAIQPGQMEFIQEFHDAGFEIGNHTYTHLNLNYVSGDKYIADVDKADKTLTPFLTQPKYFRYPYLAEGHGKKKEQVLNYLKENHYVIVPVTIDSKDYRFNESLYHVPFRSREAYIQKIKTKYLAYIWRATLNAEKKGNGAQILLIHANLINSYLLGDILQMYKEHGYRFISVKQALENPGHVISF